MDSAPAIHVANVSHAYGLKPALQDVSLQVARGEVFGLLGPNGGGKSTLFRLLSTLLPIQHGDARIEGIDVARQPARVRPLIGVTFQSPSLDGKLTVRENLRCHGWLYGLTGGRLESRFTALAEQLEIADRLHDRVETLSGGLQRRVEVAKSLLHQPRVLLLDEPSTGLDPGIRQELWRTLRTLVAAEGLTILVTTHLLDEAERCDRLAILDHGRTVATGAPDELRAAVGVDCITIAAGEAESLADDIRQSLAIPVTLLGPDLRIEREHGLPLVGELLQRYGPRIRSITIGRPTLEDVFIRHTGRRLE